MDKKEITLWSACKFSADDNALQIIQRVDSRVKEIVKEILSNYEPKPIVMIGRKSQHLLNHVRMRLDDAEFQTCFYRKVNEYVTVVRDLKIIPQELYLFIDSIHTGKEMRSTIEEFRENKFTIDKVFCYLKNRKGVNTIVDEGLITEDQIWSIFESTSEESYDELYRDLKIFFRTRIEPMESFSSFDTYSVNDIISSALLFEQINPTLEEKFDCEINFKKSEDIALNSGIEEISFIPTGSEYKANLLKSAFKDSTLIELFDININLKIKSKEYMSEFTIEPIPIVEVDHKICDVENVIKNPEWCYLKLYRAVDDESEVIKNALCNACACFWISQLILSNIEDPLISNFESIGKVCVKDWSIRPALELVKTTEEND